jgi:hypothetical protein
MARSSGIGATGLVSEPLAELETFVDVDPEPFGEVDAEAFGEVDAEAFGEVDAEAFGEVDAEAFGEVDAEAFGEVDAEAFGEVDAEAFGEVDAAEAFGEVDAEAFGEVDAEAFGEVDAEAFGEVDVGVDGPEFCLGTLVPVMGHRGLAISQARMRSRTSFGTESGGKTCNNDRFSRMFCHVFHAVDTLLGTVLSARTLSMRHVSSRGS